RFRRREYSGSRMDRGPQECWECVKKMDTTEGSLKSLNTGIITLLNYGKHVPPVVSHVTLAHEIGHNFLVHLTRPEDDLHCTPGDHGKYIMFARATSGDKKNNNKFSPCSLRSGINAVLNTKARSVKGCFTEKVVNNTEAYLGCCCGSLPHFPYDIIMRKLLHYSLKAPGCGVTATKVVEGAEECDCGWEEDCHEGPAASP
ncbi:disintegrin and metalloproteinase domain-containing protein 10, partial [Caerostris extrusa]